MKKLIASVCAFALLGTVSLAVLAHGPTPKRSTQTIDIAAPPASVWERLSSYEHIDQWHPGISASQANKGNTPGSERVITLASGGQLTDNLDVIDADRRVIAWRLLHEDVEVFPTSSYNMRITVLDGDAGGSKVEWNATFFRGDTHNEPPEHLSDEAAITAVEAFQKQGLEALKAELE